MYCGTSEQVWFPFIKHTWRKKFFFLFSKSDFDPQFPLTTDFLSEANWTAAVRLIILSWVGGLWLHPGKFFSVSERGYIKTSLAIICFLSLPIKWFFLTFLLCPVCTGNELSRGTLDIFCMDLKSERRLACAPLFWLQVLGFSVVILVL